MSNASCIEDAFVLRSAVCRHEMALAANPSPLVAALLLLLLVGLVRVSA